MLRSRGNRLPSRLPPLSSPSLYRWLRLLPSSLALSYAVSLFHSLSSSGIEDLSDSLFFPRHPRERESPGRAANAFSLSEIPLALSIVFIILRISSSLFLLLLVFFFRDIVVVVVGNRPLPIHVDARAHTHTREREERSALFPRENRAFFSNAIPRQFHSDPL